MAKRFLFSKTVQTGSGAHPASYSMGTRVLSQGSGSQGIKLTIMSGAITLLPLYAIMLWTGITLPLFLIFTRLLLQNISPYNTWDQL